MTTTYAGAQTLTMDQFLDVYELLDPPRDRFLALLLLCTGMRIGEAINLDVEQLYGDEGVVRDNLRVKRSQTKGKGRGRDIPVNLTLRRAADKYLDDVGGPAGPLFRSRQHTPGGTGRLSKRQARRVLTKACREAGLERASSHSFRKTAAVMMDDAGVPIRVISQLLGHANVAQTNAYLTRVDHSQKRRATDVILVPFATSTRWM